MVLGDHLRQFVPGDRLAAVLSASLWSRGRQGVVRKRQPLPAVELPRQVEDVQRDPPQALPVQLQPREPRMSVPSSSHR